MSFFIIRRLSLIVIFPVMGAFTSVYAQAGEEDYAALNYSHDVTKRGTSAAAFLEIGIGAKAEALGGAFTALANDVSSLYWNPAGMIRLKSVSIMATYSDWLAGIKAQYFGLVLPAENMAFGLNFTILDYVDKQPVRTILQPEGTGEYYGASDMAMGVSYGLSVTDRFSFGLSLKYIRQEVWHEKTDAFAMDVGVLYETQFEGLSIGTSMSNFGTDMQLSGRDLRRAYDADENNYSNDKLNVLLETDKFPLPLIFRFGLAYEYTKIPNNGFTISLDLIHPSNNVETMNLGFEYCFIKMIAFRAGYQSLFDLNRESGITLGFGLNSPVRNFLDFSFNYAYSNWGLLGNIQRFSLDFQF